MASPTYGTPDLEKKEDESFVREKDVSHLPAGDEVASVSDVDAAVGELNAKDAAHEISYRTMGWKKATALLLGDQVCLAIMAQAWSFSVLGWVGGFITTILSGIIMWVTSYTMWQFIMRHPEVRDICELGYKLCRGSNVVYWFFAVMLIANNVLLVGFHVLTATKVLNTLSDHSLCSVVFAAIAAIMGIVVSLPRTFAHISVMSMVSATAMAIAILLFMIFAGIEAHPAEGAGYVGDGYPTVGAVYSYAFPLAGTTFANMLNAVLNITFLWVPQILFPSFIFEMERPQDFPKALAVLSSVSFVIFIIPAIVGFAKLGQYTEAPAFGSLETVYAKASFAFAIVPTLVIGTIYSATTAKFIQRHILRESDHLHRHSLIGWGSWIGVTTAIWGIAFIFAEVIPSMGDFLSLLGAVFDSWFGFITWSGCYYSIYKGRFFESPMRTFMSIFHLVVFFIGLFLLGPGLWAAATAIQADYVSTRPAFSCANLAI